MQNIVFYLNILVLLDTAHFCKIELHYFLNSTMVFSLGE